MHRSRFLAKLNGCVSVVATSTSLGEKVSNIGRTILLSRGLACRGIALQVLISHMTFFAVSHDVSSPTPSEEKQANDNHVIDALLMSAVIWVVFSYLIRSTD
jgi:hypothetical protein